MPEERTDDADIISLGDLLSGEIGGDDEKAEEVKAKNDLRDSLEGKTKKEDFLNLDNDEDDDTPLLGEEEEEEETQKPKAEEEEEETPPVIQNERSDFYRDALRNLFGDTLDTIVIEEDGEDKEVSLDDLDIDADYFKEIVDNKILMDKASDLEDKIDAKGVSAFVKSLVEIDKNGGAAMSQYIKGLLQVKQSYSDPLEQLDLDKVDHQKEAVYLRYKAKGFEDEEIDILISGLERSGDLKSKSLIAKEELEASIQQRTEDIKQQALAVKKKAEEEEKVYRKEMKEGLDTFELKDAIKEKVVKIATKKTDKGFYQIDDLYYEAIKDPKRAAKIALFLLDEEEYNKQISSKEVRDDKLSSAKRLKITGTKSAVPQPRRKIRDNDLISLEDLK